MSDCKMTAPTGPRFHELRPDDGLRMACERHMRQVYAESFGALLPTVPRRLVALLGVADRPLAVAGLRDSNSGFLSEAYLDEPLLELGSRLAGRVLHIEEIVEVSGLAARTPWAGLALLAAIIRLGRREGRSAGLFTATAGLRAALLRARLPLHLLGPADPDRLPDAACYGRYYEHDPWVCLLLDRGEGPLDLGNLEAPLQRSLQR